MPVDRAAALRNAEKLLRQGKLEAAIEEYVRVVEDQPRDWNTTNALGDLYVRIGQTDLAVDQFVRIADSLSEEGFVPKANAIYKKILKLKPDHEHALLQAATSAVSLGFMADARAHLTAVLQRRRLRGDARGVAQIRVRLGSLDASDFESRVAAAGARVELNDVAGAVRDLKDVAAELTEKGRSTDALDVLRQAVRLAPADDDIVRHLIRAYVAHGEVARARECAATPEHWSWLAAALDERGDEDGALHARREVVRLDPGNTEQRGRLAGALLARGDAEAAAEYLTADAEGIDPVLLLTVAEVQLCGNRADAGLALVRRVLAQHPEQRERIAHLACTVGQRAADSGFAVAELATDAAVAGQDLPGAAAVLEAFAGQVPHHIPALMRLVEIAVDGGLETTMYRAQAQLADAYISAGMTAQARFLAEDLVIHDPGEAAHLARFRRALELDGESDPDAVIAERLSNQASLADDGLFPEASPILETREEEASLPPAAPPPAVPPAPAPAPRDHFDLSTSAIDLESILRELEPSPPTVHAASESVEIDLSIVLDDIGRPQPQPIRGDNIDSVFAHLRDEASHRSAQELAQEQFTRGMALRDAGDIDGCVEALQAASRAPGLRFAAASVLGRIFRDRGLTHLAAEWLERGAEAPAPTPAEGHSLLYDLADVLEADQEVARALAVCLELQAEAGAYRDVAERIDRLTRLRAQG